MQPNENNVPASCKGPPENVHVPNYKEAMETFSIPCNKEKWSKEERENLLKGVKQQFQEMLLQQCVDRLKYDFSCSVIFTIRITGLYVYLACIHAGVVAWSYSLVHEAHAF